MSLSRVHDVDELATVSHAARKVSEWTQRYEESIETAYDAGHSLNEIGNAAGLTLEGVRQLLLRRGVQLRRRGRGTSRPG
jgi:hypothetical protein